MCVFQKGCREVGVWHGGYATIRDVHIPYHMMPVSSFLLLCTLGGSRYSNGVSSTHIGDQDCVPSSQLQSRPPSDVAGIWGVNKQMGGL